VPVIGLPPNPGDQAPDQLACSIASYLANQVILEGLQAATTAITDNLSLLAMADSILTIIPEFILVRAFVDGVSIVYTAVAEGTLSDFEAALTDTTLWANITCAIYDAIVADGYVTPGNCAGIAANIHSIGYSPSAVQDAIDGYVAAIGCTGLAQLSQRAGLVAGADCSDCAGSGWCYRWDLTVEPGPFASYDSDVPTVWTSGVGWVGAYRPAASPPCVEAAIYVAGSYPGVEKIEFFYTATEAQGSSLREIFGVPSSGPTITQALGSGVYTAPHASQLECSATSLIEIGIINRSDGSTSVNTITTCVIRGSGTNPFGTSNCL
jgi:hypothetical protein